jgi:hypothetical protein
MFLFKLAFDLKKPVYEIERDMPSSEFYEWVSFYEILNERSEK